MNAAKLALLVSVAMLTSCVSDEERSRYSQPQPIPNYDVPAQVIYRIDDHRFISLENYSDCNHGDTYYNDTKEGIRRIWAQRHREFSGAVDQRRSHRKEHCYSDRLNRRTRMQ